MRFAYRLAAHFGIWDVWGWLEEISFDQLAAWHAYLCLEPFGELRSDMRSAQVVQNQINMKRKPESRPIRLDEVMLPRFGEEESRPSKSSTVKPLTDPSSWARTSRQMLEYAKARG